MSNACSCHVDPNGLCEQCCSCSDGIIKALASERTALRAEVERLKAELVVMETAHGFDIATKIEQGKATTHWREIAKKMSDYIAHEQRCVRSEWEAGEPTKNDGYRTKYRGKWYQSKPVDKTPKCECGADEVLSAYAEALKK